MKKVTDSLLKPNLMLSILKNGIQSLVYVEVGDNVEKVVEIYGESEYGTHHQDAFCLQTEGGVNVIFGLEDGTLYQMTIREKDE